MCESVCVCVCVCVCMCECVYACLCVGILEQIFMALVGNWQNSLQD